MFSNIKVWCFSLVIFSLDMVISEPRQQESMRLEQILRQFEEKFDEFQSEIRTEIDSLKSKMQDIEQRSERQNCLGSDVQNILPSKYNVFSSFGCIFESIPLSCSGDAQILVTGAEFGEYFHACADGTCCSPHPGDDCTEEMAKNRPSDWEALKEQCDGKTSCEYVYQGSVFIENCTLAEVADYARISYNCLPVSPSNMVAFTAYANTTRPYEQGQLIIYDQVITNLGGHFQLSENVFTCPYSGLYLFFISVKASQDSGRSMLVSVFMDGVYMFEAFADDQTDEQSAASNMALLYCSTGQRVWCESKTNGEQMNSGTSSSFSGVLIHIDSGAGLQK